MPLNRTALDSCASCALSNTKDTIHTRVFVNGTSGVLPRTSMCGGPGCWCACGVRVGWSR